METASTVEVSAWDTLKSTVVSFCVKYGIRLVAAIAVFIIGMVIARFISRKLSQAKVFKNVDKGIRSFALSAVKALLYIAVIIIVIGILGIPMSSVAAIIASCGVAVGLALQGSLSNLAGGIMLLIFKPFRVGDYISSGGFEGTVSDIGIFSTSLVTIDNNRVVIPNAAISNSSIVNKTYFTERMVDLSFGVDYDAPIDRVTEVLRKMAESMPQRLPDKEIICRFLSFGESCANYQLRVWCKTEDYWSLYYALLDGGKRALIDAGIKIPYPTVEIKPSDERDYRKA